MPAFTCRYVFTPQQLEEQQISCRISLSSQTTEQLVALQQPDKKFFIHMTGNRAILLQLAMQESCCRYQGIKVVCCGVIPHDYLG
jgi:hypothetical protein